MHYRPTGICEGVISHHSNKRRGILLTLESIGKKRGIRLSKLSVDRRRYGGTIGTSRGCERFPGFLLETIEWRVWLRTWLVSVRGLAAGLLTCGSRRSRLMRFSLKPVDI